MVADDMRVLKEGKPIEVEEEMNGRFYSTIKFPVHRQGKPPYLAGFTIDITERKRLEGQVVQAQKLEAVGQLAAGIAHEINTPIQYVGDNTRFLQDVFGDLNRLLGKHERLLQTVKAGTISGDIIQEVEDTAKEVDLGYLSGEIPKAIQQTLEGVERVAKIVRAMKEFSHPGTEVKTPVDINKAIESTITVSRNEWKYVAEMVTELDPFLPLVPCLPGEVNQVLLNMIINAAHAIADVVGDGSAKKGMIRVSTRRDGEWAEIRVTDTGSGIPEQIRTRIFDPFFTTKKVGKGTGQGLTISHSVIVGKHGGAISFETEIGKGTTFIIRLPLGEERAARVNEHEH
jgi:signal transduction histidine kinase